jgi:hypothetical protein
MCAAAGCQGLVTTDGVREPTDAGSSTGSAAGTGTSVATSGQATHASTSFATTASTSVSAMGPSSTSRAVGQTSTASSSTSSTNSTIWLWAFNDPDAGLESWAFDPNQTAADPNAADGVDPLNLSQQATLAWEGSGGTAPLAPSQGPVDGVMTVTIPFNAYNQRAVFHVIPVPAAAMDLSHSVLTLWVKLDPLADGGVPFSPSPSAPGGIVIYIKTGFKFVFGTVGYLNIDSTKHGWVPFSFDVQNSLNLAQSAPNWIDAGDPTNVVEIGFYFHTGGGGIPSGADAASPHANPSPATFHIDSIGISPAQQ